MLVTIVDPGTGAVTSSTGYGGNGASANDAYDAIAQFAAQTPDPIVAVVADSGVNEAWERVVTDVTGHTTHDLDPEAGAGWSAVGDPSAGQGVVNNAVLSSNEGSVSGYIQNQPQLQRLAFVPGGYLSYSTRASGSSQFVIVVQLPTPSGGSTFTSDDVRDAAPEARRARRGFTSSPSMPWRWRSCPSGRSRRAATAASTRPECSSS